MMMMAERRAVVRCFLGGSMRLGSGSAILGAVSKPTAVVSRCCMGSCAASLDAKLETDWLI